MSEELTELQEDVEHAATERGRADRFDSSAVFLEIGLVITSITLLSGRKGFWIMGIGFAAVGIVVAASGFFIR